MAGVSPLVALAAMVAVSASPAVAAGGVTMVSGSAFGFETAGVTLFGGAQNPVAAKPSVTLAPDASNSPQTGSVTTGIVQYGPATLYTSDAISVDTKASLGSSGSVTSTTSVKNVNKASTQSSTGSEELTANEISSTCTASASGTTGSTTISKGTLATLSGNSDPNKPTIVNLPANPPPNDSISGKIDLSSSDTESFHFVFDEQTASGDTLTVDAVHEYLEGPTAKGEVIIGQSVCGTNATAASVSAGSASTTPSSTAVTGGGLGTGALVAIIVGAAAVAGVGSTSVMAMRRRSGRKRS